MIRQAHGAGKRVARNVYLHVAALNPDQRELALTAAEIAQIPLDAFNVVKIDVDANNLSLLNYPTLFSEGFPTLSEAWSVNLVQRTSTHRIFPPESNQPILHRKEMLLIADHPRQAEFLALTKAAEAAGLFADTAIIGHKMQWHEELGARGLAVEGHQLVRSAPRADLPAPVILRHRTALSRATMSTPVQALWRHGLLSAVTFFDYGCGRGDDLAALQAQRVSCSGWDPHFRPDGVPAEADTVNLGFVLNVIENSEERRQALRGAWGLTRRVLSVAVLIGGRTAWERHRLFNDGVLTLRGTFQKYFTTVELNAFVAEVTGREAIAVAPGVVFVFRNDADEQDFLASRQQVRRASGGAAPRPPANERTALTRTMSLDRWVQTAELLDEFWQTCIDFGRVPMQSEWPLLPTLRAAVGSPERALTRLLGERDGALLFASQTQHSGGLLVHLALQLFQKRKSLAHLSEPLQGDIRAFFGSYINAIEGAQKLLFSLANRPELHTAMQGAAQSGAAYLDPDDGLFFLPARILDLPPVLRVLVGCAEKLYGDASNADLIKLHIRSAKVTLHHYDDFWGQAVPNLIERVKIDLARQRIDFFEYEGEFVPQPLYQKSRYLRSEDPNHAQQQDFDRQLVQLLAQKLTGHGPSRAEFDEILRATNLRIDGFEFRRT